MVLSTSQMRAEYAPHCKEQSIPGAQQAWDALAEWVRFYAYVLRAADTGSRNCRPITGGTDWSLHAYFIACTILLWNLNKRIAGGLAVDLNWQTNPYGPRLVTDMPRPMVDSICAIRTNNGKQVFRWGGYYTGNKDAMHYELVCTRADLATGINPATLAPNSEELDMAAVEEIIKEIRVAADNLAKTIGAGNNNVVASVKVAVAKAMDVDEEAIATELAPLLPNLVRALSDADVAKIAEAVADEQHRRSES